MTRYRPTWDLSTIPELALKSEWARRNGAKSKGGGRPLGAGDKQPRKRRKEPQSRYIIPDGCICIGDGPGNTLARKMFCRIVSDVPNVDRLQAVALVAKALQRSPIDVGFEIGLTNIREWKPTP